jgi:hypothetical protein
MDTSNADGVIMAVILAFIAFFVILFLIAVIMYIFQAIGLFKIAKREGREDLAWLAWIPIANAFLMMVLLERAVHEGIRGHLTLVYGISLAASIVVSGFVPFVSILPLGLFLYAFYFLAKRYSPNPILHLVIGIVTGGLSTGISIFILRNRDVVDPAGL